MTSLLLAQLYAQTAALALNVAVLTSAPLVVPPPPVVAGFVIVPSHRAHP